MKLIVLVILTVAFQIGALWCAARAWDHAGRYRPDKTKRNRYAFAAVVLSVSALLTAGSAAAHG